jgi:hypothetical protein
MQPSSCARKKPQPNAVSLCTIIRYTFMRIASSHSVCIKVNGPFKFYLLSVFLQAVDQVCRICSDLAEKRLRGHEPITRYVNSLPVSLLC